jgi:hypothetical protein
VLLTLTEQDRKKRKQWDGSNGRIYPDEHAAQGRKVCNDQQVTRGVKKNESETATRTAMVGISSCEHPTVPSTEKGRKPTKIRLKADVKIRLSTTRS